MRKPARHRPSSIDKLDPEIKRLISDLRIEHGWTIDEIRAKLEELGKPVSRSALARHTKSIEEIGRELRHSREMAKALVETTDGGEDSRVADINIELMHSVVLRLLTATSDGELVTFGPQDTMFLSRTLSGLASARKTDIEWREKAEKRGEERARKAAVAQVETVGRARGLSPDAIKAMRDAVLGDSA